MLTVVARHLLIAGYAVEGIKPVSTVKVGIAKRVVVSIHLYADGAGNFKNGHFGLSFISSLFAYVVSLAGGSDITRANAHHFPQGMLKEINRTPVWAHYLFLIFSRASWHHAYITKYNIFSI
jgi:hypothetical protein